MEILHDKIMLIREPYSDVPPVGLHDLLLALMGTLMSMVMMSALALLTAESRAI